MNKENTLYRNDFAIRSFRDVADQDYIAARLSYKYKLRDPFLWSSLQAIEKYFKAILLFNGRSSKKISHNLNKALTEVYKIDDISFSLPNDVKDFISYINNFGANRYLEHSTYLRDHALLKLDKTIWHIRKYCFYMKQEIRKNDGRVISLLASNINKVTNDYYVENPHKYSLSRGFLEKELSNNSEPSKALVWHNFFYGRQQKNKVCNHQNFNLSTNPTLTLHPEAFDDLDELVHFSKNFRKQFNANDES